jgi:hypothetical protein
MIGTRRIKMATLLSGAHQKIYQRIFQQPVPHNLLWREVWSMLVALPDANAVEDDKGKLKVRRNGHMLVLARRRSKDLPGKKELMQIRHFLERSGVPVPESATLGTHLLVVIDQRGARIYNTELHGSVPQRIAPYDPLGFGQALNYNQEDANGRQKPEFRSFYEAVARTLYGAQQILMFGIGAGAGNAMEQLLIELKRQHRDLAERIVASIVVDEHDLTEDQLLAKARELFVVAQTPPNK